VSIDLEGGTPTVQPAAGAYNSLRVEITTTSGGLPTTTVVETADIIRAAGEHWNDVTFATPQSVTANVLYAIQVIAIGSPAIVWNGTCDGTVYTRGEALINDGSWVNMAGYAANHIGSVDPAVYCQMDYGFQEFIQDPPAASPTAASPTGATQPPTSTVAPADKTGDDGTLLLIGGLAAAAAASAGAAAFVVRRRNESMHG
jgi:LPXTG-motif cell wall-anchored protein